MNTVRVAEKPLNLTYIHSRADNRTIVDGGLLIDPANKVSANYMVGTNNCKLKYTMHAERLLHSSLAMTLPRMLGILRFLRESMGMRMLSRPLIKRLVSCLVWNGQGTPNPLDLSR